MGGKRIKSVKRLLGHVKAIRTWQLFLILILLVFASATLLRLDHIKMTELRDTVLEMDKEGNDEELAAALNKLQDFTLNHIVVNIIDENGLKKIEFGTGVFYLEQSYLRAAAKVMQEVSEMEVDDSNPNGNIYGIVSSVCRARALANGWNWDNPNYINCFIEELAKYPVQSEESGTVSALIPSTELYRREFVSPVWTPSLSGFIILLVFVLSVVIFIRVLIWIVLEITLIILRK